MSAGMRISLCATLLMAPPLAASASLVTSASSLHTWGHLDAVKPQSGHVGSSLGMTASVVRSAHVGVSSGAAYDAHVGAGARDVGVSHGAHVGSSSDIGAKDKSAAGKTQAAIAAAVDRVLSFGVHGGHDTPAGLDADVQSNAAQMDLETAMKAVAVPEVVSLVRREGTQQAPTAAEVDQACITLNDMIVKAQARLDNKVIECKDFMDQNTESQNQASGDLARLGQTLGDLARQKTKALTNFDEVTTHFQQTKEEQERVTQDYMRTKNATSALLEQRKRDLEVAEYILDLTKCEGAGPSFLDRGAGAGLAYGIEVCPEGSGVDLRFEDPRIAGKTSKLTPDGQRMVQVALSRAEAGSTGEAATTAVLRASGMAYGHADFELDDGDVDPPEDAKTPSRLPSQSGLDFRQEPAVTTPAPAMPATRAPPVDANKQANKCASSKPNCGVLHDSFAALWGDMKDLVDETTAKMQNAEEAWETMDKGFNMQLEGYTTQKGTIQSALSEATSETGAHTWQQTKKQQEAESLTTIYKTTMKECRQTVTAILFTEICGVVKVRNELVTKAEPKAESITDCQVSQFVPGQCSTPCDEKMEGGNMTLTRDIISKASAKGATCPPLEIVKKCNQKRCPTNCKVGEWSSFTKCTKECGGGVQSRTRSLQQKPKDGGHACDSLQESRPCNTGSCDRNCKMGAWEPFSSCSKSCNVGFTERVKKIIIPTLGEGACPKETNHLRYEKKQCNQQACAGDEQCVDSMDLVIAIDGSGSLTQKGFEILKKFAANLVRRMKSDAYGHQAVRVAVVQFGNGALDDKRVVADAKLVVPMAGDSNNMDQVAIQIEGLQWQRGFTNMAQAFLKAKDVLNSNSRSSAKAVTLMVTDGRPSFVVQTQNALDSLKSVSRVVIVQVQAHPQADKIALMKKWASIPSQTNYFLIPGKKALKGAMESFVNQVLVTACQSTESPSLMLNAAHSVGYHLVQKDKDCGKSPDASEQPTVDACFLFAEAKGAWANFAFGDGTCSVYVQPCTEWTRNSGSSSYEKVQPIAGMPTRAPTAADMGVDDFFANAR